MFVPPRSNSYIEILMPDMLVFGGGAFGGEGGTLMNGIHVLIKKIPQIALAPVTSCEDTARRCWLLTRSRKDPFRMALVP